MDKHMAERVTEVGYETNAYSLFVWYKMKEKN
jgi:hypothetical protein